MAVPTDGAARLLGTMLGLIAHGIYICTFVFTMVRLQKTHSKQRLVPAIIIVLFIIVTLSIPLQIIDVYKAFVQYEGGPEAFYNNFPTGTRLSAGSDLLLLLSYNLADAFLIWRLFIIWGRNYYIIVFPVLLQVAGLAFGSIVVADEFKNVKFTMNYSVYASITLTLILNIFVTGLICGRLWCTGRTALNTARSSAIPAFVPSMTMYQNIIFYMLESGSLYTATVTLWTLMNVADSIYAAIVFSYFLLPVVGIVPTVITLRLNTVLRKPDMEQAMHSCVVTRRTGAFQSGGVTVTTDTEVDAGPSPPTSSKAFEMSQRFPKDADETSETASLKAPSLGRRAD